MKKILAFFSVVFLSAALYAQMDITKIGVIDTARVYTTYFRDSTAVRNYENMKLEFQAEVDRTTAEIKELNLKKTQFLKDNDELSALRTETEITKKTDYLLEYTRSKNAELEAMKNKLADSDDFYKSLYNIIERIAEAGGYSMVMSLQQANAIIWYSQSVDITDQVINSLIR
ncbi:MAG: OmpH family outer membrane protein [Treponemataceae bacterium]|nr:OmpH family outer membrane protein [Treponemataceae bacterium]